MRFTPSLLSGFKRGSSLSRHKSLGRTPRIGEREWGVGPVILLVVGLRRLMIGNCRTAGFLWFPPKPGCTLAGLTAFWIEILGFARFARCTPGSMPLSTPSTSPAVIFCSL